MNWSLLQNSLLVSISAAILATGIGATVALCALGSGRICQRILLLSSMAALALPPFLVTNTWLDLFGAGGVLRPWIPFNLFSLGGTIAILTFLLWPLPFLLVWSAWQKVESAQVESEPMLRGFALLRWLLWPLARNSVGIAVAITFVLALNNFAVPSILQVKVFPAEVWVAFNTSLDAAAAFKTSWPMLLAPLVLVLALRWFHVEWPRTVATASHEAIRRRLGRRWIAVAAIVSLLAILVSLILPVAQLAAAQRTWTEFLPAMTASSRALVNSVIYAVGAAMLVIALGALLWRTRVLAASWLLFFVPGILLGVALSSIANRSAISWLYGTFGIVLLAFAVRYFAIGWNIARVAFKNVDPNIVDAVRLEGGRGLTLFRLAHWPMAGPQLAAAAYIVYLLCLWEVETLILIVPPGGETLATRIFNLLHYGHNAHVNALCVLLLAVALVPLFLWEMGRLLFRRHAQFPVALFSIAGTLFLTSCSSSDQTPAVTPIQSSLFSDVQIIGARGTSPGQFNKPRSVALDTNDNLFVVDMTGRVQKFSPDGRYLLSWQMPQTDLGKPKGMDRDRQGNIVVLEPHYQRVNHFTPDGKLVSQWGRRGTNAGELTLPRAIAIDSRNNVIVSEYTLVDRVQKFTPGGTSIITAWGIPGLKAGEFNRAEGVGLDARDRIYVADSCNHRIQIFSPEGKYLRAYGKSGTGPGELSYPYDIRVDSAGRQYVCEFGNSRIQIFDASDHVIEIIGQAGAHPGEFNNPWSIAFDSKGNLYVADSQNHRVQKFLRKKREVAQDNPAKFSVSLHRAS